MAILSGLLNNHCQDNNNAKMNQRSTKTPMLFFWALLVFASMNVPVVGSVPVFWSSHNNENTNDKYESNGNEKKNKKKFYAIHIGPSKTGTTALQNDSGENPGFRKALELDGVSYLGKFSNTNKTRSQLEPITLCMINIYRKHWNNNKGISKSSATLLRERLINDCWGKNNEHYTQTSIVDSCEGYSYSNDTRSAILNHIDVLRTILVDYFDYDELIVIGAYRPYAQWLTSVYKEDMLQNCLNHNILPRKGTRYNHNRACPNVWKQTKLQVIDRGLHQYNALTQRREYLNIDATLAGEQQPQELIAKKLTGIDVKILHLYHRYDATKNHNGYNSITTEFYCNALGETRTPNTCHFSRDRNTSSGSSSGTTFHQGNSYDTIWFDDILIAAAHHGLLRGKTKRRDARNRLKEYYERELELESSSNETTISTMKGNHAHFPLLCPTQTELEIFLKKSLEFEELVKTKFSLQELGTGDNGDGDKEEASEHTRHFWKMANEEKAFCWVDTEKLFLEGESNNNNVNGNAYYVVDDYDSFSSNSTSFWRSVFRKAFPGQDESSRIDVMHR